MLLVITVRETYLIINATLIVFFLVFLLPFDIEERQNVVITIRTPQMLGVKGEVQIMKIPIGEHTQDLRNSV